MLPLVAIPGAISTVSGALSSVTNLFGGTQPTLVPVGDVLAMIGRLSNSERAELQALTKPFGWYTGNLEGMAGKIAAELRDAKSSAEVALYNFVTARTSTQPAVSQQSTYFGNEVEATASTATRNETVVAQSGGSSTLFGVSTTTLAIAAIALVVLAFVVMRKR